MVSLTAPAGSINILIVEDNAGDVRLMREAFQSHSFVARLSVVENGELALDYLRKSHRYPDAVTPDLIFLDLNLPKRDGREVLAEIKTDAQLRRIPVIVFTTSESQWDVRNAYNLHANCYIRKPSDLQEFFDVIRACEEFWLRVAQLPS